MPSNKDNYRKAELCIYIEERAGFLTVQSVNPKCIGEIVPNKRSNNAEMWAINPRFVTEGTSYTKKSTERNSHFIHKAIITTCLAFWFNPPHRILNSDGVTL